MFTNHLFRYFLILFFFCNFFSFAVLAQSTEVTVDNEGNTITTTTSNTPLRIVSEEERDIILSDLGSKNEKNKKPIFAVIPFSYNGITENSATIFGDRLADDLNRQNRFNAIPPSQNLGLSKGIKSRLIELF